MFAHSTVEVHYLKLTETYQKSGTKNILHRMDIGWPSDRMGSYTILYSIHTHQMQKGWRLDLDRIESAMLTKENI